MEIDSVRQEPICLIISLPYLSHLVVPVVPKVCGLQRSNKDRHGVSFHTLSTPFLRKYLKGLETTRTVDSNAMHAVNQTTILKDTIQDRSEREREEERRRERGRNEEKSDDRMRRDRYVMCSAGFAASELYIFFSFAVRVASKLAVNPDRISRDSSVLLFEKQALFVVLLLLC